MSEHLLESETTILASRDDVFAFFSEASNLMATKSAISSLRVISLRS